MGKYLSFFRNTLQTLRSPVFLTMLGISFILWYGFKLSYVYTAEVPISVKINGDKYRVRCLVEARGSELWSHRLSLKDNINIALSELAPQIDSASKYYIINTTMLSSAIMQRNSSLKVIEVIDSPKIPNK